MMDNLYSSQYVRQNNTHFAGISEDLAQSLLRWLLQHLTHLGGLLQYACV